MSTRDLFVKLPAIALLALAAACGGGDDTAATDETTTTGETGAPAATTTPAAPPAAGGTTATTPDAGGKVVEVRMVTTQGGASGVFEPANVTVNRGDVIRWTMADAQAAHNVSFTQAQGNPGGFTPPADSPYLNQAGQTFEVKVDWQPGTYNYVCIPHSATGMAGSVTVQ